MEASDEVKIGVNLHNKLLNIENSISKKADIDSDPECFKLPIDYFHSNDNEVQSEKIHEQQNIYENFNIENIKYDSPLNISSSKLKFWILENKDTVLAAMHHPCKFYFWGQLQVEVISGSVNVNGYICSSNFARSYPMFSPRNYSLLYIKTHKVSNLELDIQLTNSEIKDIVKSFIEDVQDIHYILLLLKPLNHFPNIVLNKFYPLLFPNSVDDLEEAVTKVLNCIFVLSCNKFTLRTLKISSSWNKIIDLIQKQIRSELFSKVMVCGGKNVGKSTLLRYIINSCLNYYEYVLCLDVDPGQSEFSPPGSLSLLKVTSPLLGPNFTHLIQPISSIFLGIVSISYDPWRYLKAVTYLVDKIKTIEHNKILIVNTMGWPKGLGLDMLVETVLLVQPTIVCEIRSKNYTDNFENLAAHNIKYYPRFGTFYNENPVPFQIFDYSLLQFSSHIKNSDETYYSHRFQKPSTLRDIVVVSYFAQLYQNKCDLEKPLRGFAPYKVCWESVYFYVCHINLPADQVLYAINGNFVALSHGEESEDKCYITQDNVKILKEFPFYDCLGYGIIRGIDFSEKELYLITPLNENKLQEINIILLGAINLPSVLRVEENGPYVSMQDCELGLHKHHKGRMYKRSSCDQEFDAKRCTNTSMQVQLTSN